MPNMSGVLLILGFVLLGVITCALSLKIVIWALNALFFSGEATVAIPRPGIFRSLGINLLSFGVISLVSYAVMQWLAYIPRAESFKIGTSVEWLIVYGGFAYSIVIFWRMLPTTFWRAALVAAADWMLLFFVSGIYFMLMMMYAYSGHSTGK
jgi:membrane-bound ClpP family serine protease